MTDFITYTKGAVMYVTTPGWESLFLDRMNKIDDMSSYERRPYETIAVPCSPRHVHAVAKQSATILKLVKPEGTQ